jgi:hypothetical protein
MNPPITNTRPRSELLPCSPSEMAPRAPHLPATTWAIPRRRADNPMPLPPQVTEALWVLLMALTCVTVWLVGEIRTTGHCTRHACRLASLGGHLSITLILAATSLTVLLALAFPTRAWRRTIRIERRLIAAAAAVGTVACVGALLVVLIFALAVALTGCALLLVLAIIVAITGHEA